MNKKIAIIISPNQRDYAEKYLAECVDSIRKQDYAGEMKIFIIDNESTEESYAYLRRGLFGRETPPLQAGHKIPLPAQAGLTLPHQVRDRLFVKGGEMQPPLPPLSGGQVEIIRNENNDGFAKGNNDAIKKALKQGFEYVILFNMDTVLEPDCLKMMVKAAEMQPPLSGGQIGAVQARIMLYKVNLCPASPYKGEGTINSLGNVTHFLGFGYASGYGEKYNPPNPPCPADANALAGKQGGEICYPSGAAVLFKREALEKVGLFDEEFWMYNEDQDLGWRIWLAGYKCVLAPKAVVYHKYEFSRSIKKYYWLDRNRIIAMLKNYHWLTILLITPAGIIMEIGLIFFSLKNGWFKEKIRVYKYFFSLKNWRYILQARREVQKLRLVKDRDIVKLFSGRIWYQEVGEWRLKVANVAFNTYWQIAKFIIRW